VYIVCVGADPAGVSAPGASAAFGGGGITEPEPGAGAVPGGAVGRSGLETGCGAGGVRVIEVAGSGKEDEIVAGGFVEVGFG
jgi:hypothetical protein